jgi:hypothetical protein
MVARSVGSLSESGSISKHRSKESLKVPMNWRMDPKKSKSDWTLRIVRQESGLHDSYYVHKSILKEMPPDRAYILFPLFENNVRQKDAATSEIIASENAADAFDSFLDFMYCKSPQDVENFLLKAENGLKLYGLAEYFELYDLQKMLATFYKENILATDVIDFMNEARKFESDDMLEAALEQFAYALHTVEYVQEDQLEPEFLLKVLKKRKTLALPSNRSDSENISCLIALCSKYYKHQLTRKLFYKITDEEYIPHLDQEAALQLLVVEEELKFWRDKESFSNLQSRCIRSLLLDWKELRERFESDTAFWKALQKLSPGVLAILLMHSTGTAGDPDDERQDKEEQK